MNAGETVEIRQIQQFLAVVDTGSLSAAARLLGITQSGVSVSIATLERELGAALFLRSPGRRQAELTDAGMALLPGARGIMENVVAAHCAVASTREAMSRGVRVASIGTPEGLGLRDAWEAFRVDHPDLRLSLFSGETMKVAQMVADDEVDFGVAAIGPAEEKGLQVDVLLMSPLAVFCPRDHPLAGAGGLTPNDVAAQRVIGLSGQHRPRQLFDEWSTRSGRQSPIISYVECDDPLTVLPYVREGVGVTYGPMAFAGQLHSLNLVAIPLQGAPDCYLSIVSRPETSPTAVSAALRRAYTLHCRSYIASQDSLRQFSPGS